MPFEETGFPGLLVFTPRVFEDPRGYFFESFNQKTFAAEGLGLTFLQDNQANSCYGVIRGLHFQQEPHAQTKLIRVLKGEILDVVVDIRSGSPTFGKVYSIRLSEQNKKQLLVPKGFAHGYSVLSASAEVFYKCDEFYHKESEGGIAWNDPGLAINWEVDSAKAIISEKDTAYLTLAQLPVFFKFDIGSK